MSDKNVVKPENQKQTGQKAARIPRDYFKISDTPNNVAKVVTNTKPKKRGNWSFENRE